ncbi:MAG: ATP-binding protein [Patescibacteria group bacterium]
MDTLIRTLLLEWKDRKLPDVTKRDFSIELSENNKVNNAIVITGFRRVGKTYIVLEAVNKLLSKYSREEVIYLNFEDERIINPDTNLLTDLIPEAEAVFGKKPKFLFLDELQLIPNWSKWVRRVLDSEDIKLVITGSSSKMGSSELPTELRGRAEETKIVPLNLDEFMRFKGQEKIRLPFLLNEYLIYGGLPAVVLSPEEKKLELLQSYYRTVVQREVIDRYKIKNENVLKTLLTLLINSNYITISKLFNSLKSLGLAVGKTTIDKYINNIKSSYFMEELNIFNYKIINQLMYPRKNYFVDTGFISALSTKFSKNMGRLFENMVYQKLKTGNENIFYWKDERDREVDFVILEGGKVRSLYQACYDISDEDTFDREVKSLLRAQKVFGCDDLNLLTVEIPKNYKEIKGIKIFSVYQDG